MDAPRGDVLIEGMESGATRRGPERLRVHDLALQFADRLEEVLSQTRCSASLREQLVRAAESAVLNIAEGSAHSSHGRKAYHYEIAHGSIAECIAGLLLLKRRDARLDIQPLRRTADMICVMLRSLVRRFQERKGR